jgi:biofilm PGA synthesis N-glycosyltransferase PgaC
MSFEVPQQVSHCNISKLPMYVVISPVRDESEFISLTIESMIKQTIKPVAWIIVNDGSKDKTEAIVRQYLQNYPWIKLVNRQDRGIRQRGKGVVEAFYAGFNTLAEDYEFIVKLDGDLSFEPDFFETLLMKFASDPRLGIAGGGVYERPDGKSWVLFAYEDEVRGPNKMYRRSCFEAIRGLVPAMGWDGIDEWKALSAGWKVQSFFEIKVFHYRLTGAATGFLKSYVEQGHATYFMGYQPLYLIARGIRCMVDRPIIIGGLAMVGAYFGSYLQGKKRIPDEALIHFIRQTQLRRLAGLLHGKPIHETPKTA